MDHQIHIQPQITMANILFVTPCLTETFIKGASPHSIDLLTIATTFSQIKHLASSFNIDFCPSF